MSQNKIDYPEQIYKAIDIITNKRLEALQYDITIEATITDDKQAEKGVYTVSNGNASFLAYSRDSEYKNDDVVMVTIPQGNYNNQKIIVGKKINEEKEETPIEFKRPFSNLINITNNILDSNDQSKEYSFIANGEKYCWDITASDIPQSSYKENEYILINLSKIGYTRIGVKADFSTLLKEYQVVSGNYGLEFVLSFSNPDSSDNDDIIRTFSLDCKNFFGNIYNSDIYQTQELVFDISDLQKYVLKTIKIYPYQRNNFKNIDNQILEYEKEALVRDNIRIKNIYVCLGFEAESFKNDSVKITSETGSLYVKVSDSEWLKNKADEISKALTPQDKNKLKEILKDLKNSKYANIEPIKTIIKDMAKDIFDSTQVTKIKRLAEDLYCEKFLNAQWIHENEDTDIIKMIQEDEIPSKYHVWWYIYDREASDLYAGAGWKRFYGCKPTIDPKTGSHLITKEETREIKINEYNNEYDAIKNSIKETSEKDKLIEELNLKYPEDVTDHLENIYFIPNVTEQTQWLKIIIVKEKENINKENAFTDNSENYFYDKIVESPIFVLENQNEVANKATKIEATALSIRYEDKQRGLYSLYNEAGALSKGEDSQLRVLTAVFDINQEDLYEKPLLSQPYSSIKWTFPASNSMIIPIENILPIEIETLDISTIKILNKPEINENTILIDNKYYIIKDKDVENDDYIIIRYNNDADTFEFLAEDIPSNKTPLLKVGYYIKDIIDYALNDNTVLLEVLKEGSAFATSVNMRFGKQGTSGSDYTIDVQWENLSPTFIIKDGNEEGKLSGTVVLKDKDGNAIDPGGGTYTYKWYKVFSNGKTFEQKKEEKDLYYPVVTVDNVNTGVDWMWREWNPSSEGESGLHYYHWDDKKNKYPRYWLWENEVDTDQLVTYDFVEKKFIKISTKDINSQYTIVYGKLKKEKDKDGKDLFVKRDIIDFKPIDKIELTPYKNGNEKRCGVFKINEKGESVYYYYNPDYDKIRTDGLRYTNASSDKKKKAFIKYNDIYLIDPSPKYQENQTYYYPVYSNEKDYNSGNILRIQDNGNGNFVITDTESEKDKTRTRIPSINDLYILEISLDNFLEYPLIARFPISFELSDNNFTVASVEGATEVRYATSGETSFKKNPYQISIDVYDNNKKIYRTIKQGYNKDETVFGHWELIYDNDFNNINTNFLPSLIESNEINIEEHFNNFKERLEITSTQGDKNKQKEFLTLLKFAEVEADIETHFSEIDDTNKNKYFLSRHFDDCLEQLKINSQISLFQKIFKNLSSSSNNFDDEYDSTKYNLITTYYDTLNDDYINNELDNLFQLLKLISKHYLRDLKEMSDKYNILRNKDLYFIKPYLLPSKVYFKDIPICGIKFVIDFNLNFDSDGNLIMSPNISDEAIIKSNTVVWSSSIYFYQDNYPSKTLNRWNGKEIVTDEDLGIVLANGFSAGKKEDDNTFTGVILGDWSKDTVDSFIAEKTGIFGFNHGAMSYALKDDGTAFFGKDGSGRIYFDGNTAQIYSSRWIQPVEIMEEERDEDGKLINSTPTKTYNQQEQGMMLDIDDGIFKIKSIVSTQYDNNGSFILTMDSTQPTFFLNTEYQNEKNDTYTEALMEKKKIKKLFHLQMSSSNPYLSIGNDVFAQYKNGHEYFGNHNYSYNHDLIRINDHGGWLTSYNYSPPYYIHGYPSSMIMPDNLPINWDYLTSTTLAQPLRGLVIDLSNGSIILGNDAEIKGYQTGRWPDANGVIDSTHCDQRVFVIHTGATTSFYDGKGKIVSRPPSGITPNSKEDYFILAQKRNIANNNNENVFRVSWNGNTYIENLYIKKEPNNSSKALKMYYTDAYDQNHQLYLRDINYKGTIITVLSTGENTLVIS